MRFLLLFLLSMISSLAFGADSAGGIGTETSGGGLTLTPPPGDLSVSLLASIFGVVDGVLHGTGSQILGAMFGVYNAAILTVGMIILVYILVVGTLNTAHEGEVMGKKWSSIWLPLRTVVGVALLLPKASGYSFIQIMVMWVVVQGVGAADMVWGRALDYLGRGGVVVQAPQVFTPEQAQYAQSFKAGSSGSGYYQPPPPPTTGTPGTNLNAFLIPIAGTILKSEICTYALQNILNNKIKADKNPNKKQIPFLMNTLKVEQADPKDPTSLIMYFPGTIDLNDNIDYKGMCGSVKWVSSGDNAQPVNKVNATATDSRSIAIQQIVLDLQPQAQRVANLILPQTGGFTVTVNPPTLTSLLTDNGLFYATTDYIGIITPYLQKQSRANNADIEKFINEAKSVGWILAGAYYFDISSIKSAGAVKETSVITADFPDLTCSPLSTSCKTAPLKGAFQPLVTYLSPTAAQCPAIVKNDINTYICNEFDNNGVVGGRNSQANPNTPASASKPPSTLFDRRVRTDTDTTSSIFFSAISFGITGCIETANNLYASMGDIYHAQTIGGNPIIMVAQLGVDLVNTVERIYISSIALILSLSILGAVIAFGFSAGAGTALMNTLLWLLPLLSAILLPLLVAGATMAYYVPMIPFILFLFGAMTWFASVIEAMIAAPLVALGLAHPEGHEHLGRAEYAVMLLANVFFRPLLMIFGFIVATILSSVMLWLLNYGFTKVWTSAAIKGDWLGVIYFVATIVVYMTIVLTIINRSFALIYDVPNKVLRWIGGQVEQTGEGAALEEFKAGAVKGLETGAQLTGKTMDMAMEAGPGAVKGAVQVKGGSGKGGPEGDVS